MDGEFWADKDEKTECNKSDAIALDFKSLHSEISTYCRVSLRSAAGIRKLVTDSNRCRHRLDGSG